MIETEVIDFGSLEPIFIKCKLNGQDHYLHEPSEDVYSKYMNKMLSESKTDKAGTVQVSSFAEARTLLVQGCLRKADNKSVYTINEVKGFPSKVVDALATKIRQLGGMDEPEPEKKDEKDKEGDPVKN